MLLLAKNIPREDTERHHRLIREYSKNSFGTEDVEIEFLGNGAEKGVYKVKYTQGSFLASAAAIDPKRGLLEEYRILHQLYGGAPEYFPRPMAHYSASDERLGELITMELLPHKDLNKLSNPGRPNFYREVAYEIGKAVATVNFKTGLYSTEPHDGNILARDEAGKIEIKFCDAIQFKPGNIENTVNSILLDSNMRPECFRFIKQFRNGIAEAMLNQGKASSLTEAEQQLNFLRKYNPIF